MASKYLRQERPEGDRYYIYEEELAKRADMFPYDGEPPEPQKYPDLSNMSGPRPEPVEKDEAAQPAADDEKIDRLAAIIDDLEKEDFTASGKPRVDALERELGDSVTMDERDAAQAKHDEVS
jgi:hypothetical protein